MTHFHQKKYSAIERNSPSRGGPRVCPTEPAFRDETNRSRILVCLRGYFFVIGLVALGCAGWKYHLYAHAPQHGGPKGFQTCVNGLDFATYVLVVFFLLIPWWRLGSVVCALGYSVALPACIYVVGGYLVVDLLYVHQQTLFLLLLLTGLLAQIFWLFNRLGADSRKVQAAESCKLHLRNHHPDELDLVDQFIIEIEGDENHPDKAQWSRFADADGRCDRTSKQLELEFERWLERYLVQSEASESGIPALL